jgi:ubiquinone/menaquinone biosynthesis C-methylase UbiE
VFCVNAFHHFSGKAGFLNEARRVLRPKGGVMIIGLDPHTGQEHWWVYDYFLGVLALDKKRYSTSAAIRAAMAEAGFTRSETREAQRIIRQDFARGVMERGLLDPSVTS